MIEVEDVEDTEKKNDAGEGNMVEVNVEDTEK